MANVDVLVRGGRIVLSDRVIEADVLIDEGRISSIGSSNPSVQADRVIEAGGKYIIPGAIDPHTHFGIHPESRSFDADVETESPSAIGGGITTIMNYLSVFRGTVEQSLPEYSATVAKKSLVNVVFQVQPNNMVQLDELQDLTQAGISSFKFFTNKTSHIVLDDGLQYLILERIRRLGALAKFHCENSELNDVMTKRAKEEGLRGPPAWDSARPPVSEYESISKTMILAKATGCPIYIVHTSIGSALRLKETAIREGIDMTLETCPHYLTLAKDDRAQLGKINPPIRSREDAETLWEGIRTGYVQCIGSDYFPHFRRDLTDDIWTTGGGVCCMETMLPVLLSEGVNRRGLSIHRVVEISSANTASIHGIVGKGALLPGYDADVTVVDLDKEVIVSPEVLHSASDFTPYDGKKLKGWPVATILGGDLVMQDGQILGRPGMGKVVLTQVRRNAASRTV